MVRRSLPFLLVAGLLSQATGLTLALHLHTSEVDHDEHQCPACQFLLHSAKALPPNPAPTTLDLPADEPLIPPVGLAHPIQFEESPHTPRAPPRT